MALDGDGARVALDPRRGGREAVAQAVLNVACSGADPAAITNCLNFGNPERPATAYALREAISGMAEACQAFETPVVSGNVSLYNEHSGSPIHPTPVVGAVGVLERAELAVPSFPRDTTLVDPAPGCGGAGPRRQRAAGARGRRGLGSHPRSRTARARRPVRGARRGGERASCSPRRTTPPTAGSSSRPSSSAWAPPAAASSSFLRSPSAATSRCSARPAATCS